MVDNRRSVQLPEDLSYRTGVPKWAVVDTSALESIKCMVDRLDRNTARISREARRLTTYKDAKRGAFSAPPPSIFHATLTVPWFILLSRFRTLACQRLSEHAFAACDPGPLIEEVHRLCGDDVQTFIDVIHEARSPACPSLLNPVH